MKPLKIQNIKSIHKILIANLHHFIEKEKIHEAELSRQTGIPQPTLHKILAGTTTDPRISTLQTLANYFGVTLDMLFSNQALKNNQGLSIGKSIPLISWSDCLKSREIIKNISSSNHDQWIISDDYPSDQRYALKSRANTEPQFPRGSIFIVDAKTPPSDGDLVIVHYPETKEATLRELSIDGRTSLLLSISDKSKADHLTKSIKVLGIVIQSRFSYPSK
ncbi:MAG: helix-turn-helix domain-containing protein [Gammaproteobacteria bacterium]|nr:helix-turn-helix domain-containing protein [Gammaproteobacteria bacterium]